MTNNKQTKTLSIRDGFGQGIAELVERDSKVVVLTADLAESTRVSGVFNHFPSQAIECGVSEQNMMGVAAGLAAVGKIPFVNSFAVFSPGRSWDQLRVSVCYNKTNVKVVGHHVGFSASFDGATHQALEDIALTRVLPNLVVLQPCDFHEARQCVFAAAKHNGPTYLRISKSSVGLVTDKDKEFVIGKGEVLQQGRDLTLVISGALTASCLAAARQVVSAKVEIIKLSTIKPLDVDVLKKSAQKTKRVLVVEDHQVAAGLGSAVAETLSECLPVPVYRHGVFDTFGESGSESDLLSKYKLDTIGISQKITQVARRDI